MWAWFTILFRFDCVEISGLIKSILQDMFVFCKISTILKLGTKVVSYIMAQKNIFEPLACGSLCCKHLSSRCFYKWWSFLGIVLGIVLVSRIVQISYWFFNQHKIRLWLQEIVLQIPNVVGLHLLGTNYLLPSLILKLLFW